MKNLIFVHNENIPLVNHHDDDYEGNNNNVYDDYNIANISRVDEATMLSSTDKQAKSTDKKQNEISWLHCTDT